MVKGYSPVQSLRLAETRQRLAAAGLRPRKGLGQHFLIDVDVLNGIVAAADPTSRDIILEIGPGLGVLTRELARRAAHVFAVELDDNLARLLAREMAGFNNVTIINGDILKLDITPALAAVRRENPAATGYKVTANLPYYITAPVLRHLLEARVRPESLVVTVQREVAAAIADRDRMGLLAVSVRFYGEPEVVAAVPAQCFYPAPRVDSAILRIKTNPQPPLGEDMTPGFFALVRAGFAAPRKRLLNSLAQGLGTDRPEVAALLSRAGIDAERRAETLNITEWVTLFRIYRERTDAYPAGAGQD